MSTLRPHPVRMHAPDPDRHRSRGESGASIIIAVVMVTVIVTLTIGLLGFAQVGAKSHRAYKVERTNRVGIDSAINAGIQYLAINPDKGVMGGSNCFVQIPIEGDVHIVVGNAYFIMECAATKASTGGALADSGQVPAGSGVQNPRDVTITISCGNDSSNLPRPGYASCGTGTLVPVATARVRFDRDTSPGVDPTKSAVIPKVLSWEVRN